MELNLTSLNPIRNDGAPTGPDAAPPGEAAPVAAPSLLHTMRLASSVSVTEGRTGAAELAKVAGEEAIGEEALRRDDDLGRLAAKAFDEATAAAALPPLGIS